MTHDPTKHLTMLITLGIALALTGVAPAITPASPLSIHAVDEVDDRLAEGREHLLADDLGAARTAFEAAAAIDGGWRTEQWILRVDAADDPESVLGRLSSLARSGKSGPEIDYLFGVAFSMQAANSPGGLMFNDAQARLKAALDAEPDRFADAWILLAEAARNTGDNALSLAAAEACLQRQPKSVRALDLQGRAALAMFAQRYQEEPRPDEVQGWYDTARTAFTRITEQIRRPRSAAEESTLASAWNQLASVHAYGDDLGAARNAYGEAMGWDPVTADPGTAFNVLGLQRFVGCIDYATERFVERHTNDNRESTLQWWRGWALYANNGDLADAEAAMERAVALWPGYTNCWYWLMRIRYDQQLALGADERDFSSAIDAFERYGEVDRAGLIVTVKAEPVDKDRIVFLVGRAANRDLDAAAFMSEILTELEPGNDEFWNNLGLFLRDSAQSRAIRINQALRRGETIDPSEGREVSRRYERSWEAYNRALELAPEKPAYYNDAGVMLHYYLERDYDQAFELYDRCIELANEVLAAGGLEEADAAKLREYVGWAEDNKRLLTQKIEGEEDGSADE